MVADIAGLVDPASAIDMLSPVSLGDLGGRTTEQSAPNRATRCALVGAVAPPPAARVLGWLPIRPT